MTYRLVPLLGGYYDERPLGEPCRYVPTMDVPTIAEDLAYLCDGDSFIRECSVGGYMYGGYSLRSQVLIVSDIEQPREGL